RSGRSKGPALRQGGLIKPTGSGGVSVAVVCLVLLAGPLPAWASAQAYPSRPIRLITGQTGSATDIRARWLAERLRTPLGQSRALDNRGGAGGTLGTEVAAKSAPDGYTVVVVH